MNISSPTSLKPPEPKSILLIGPPGGGKSTLLLQFPKLCYINIDRNISGPIDYLDCIKKPTDYVEKNCWMGAKGESLEINHVFDRLIDHLTDARDALKKDPKTFANVGVDGLTTAGDAIKQKIFIDQRRSAMETRDWDTYKSGIVKIAVVRFKEIVSLGANVILICHEKYKYKKDKQDMMNDVIVSALPSVQGESEYQLAGQFSDVWRCQSFPAPGGKVEYKIQTVKDGIHELKKSSYRMPNEILIKDGESAWTKLEPYLKGMV